MQYIFGSAIGFSGNVIVGLASGYSSQYTGIMYVVYLFMSAGLYALTFLVILKMIDRDTATFRNSSYTDAYRTSLPSWSSGQSAGTGSPKQEARGCGGCCGG